MRKEEFTDRTKEEQEEYESRHERSSMRKRKRRRNSRSSSRTTEGSSKKRKKRSKLGEFNHQFRKYSQWLGLPFILWSLTYSLIPFIDMNEIKHQGITFLGFALIYNTWFTRRSSTPVYLLVFASLAIVIQYATTILGAKYI